MTVFDRAISESFEEALVEEAQRPGWWRDVLDDPELVIALRGQYLNVYWQGQSLFKVTKAGKAIRATTHKKYLINPDLSGQVGLIENSFSTTTFKDSVLAHTYEGPETLKRMKRIARLYSGAEKRGVHTIVMNNPSVIDLEVAFSGTYAIATRETKNPRIDLAAIEAQENAAEARLVFWEAKHFTNPELRAIDENNIEVRHQVDLYRKCLLDNREAVERSYTRVAKNISTLIRLRPSKPISQRPSSIDVLDDIAHGRRRLTLGDVPKVGLLVYGFDKAQRDHEEWLKHTSRLQRLVGDYLSAGDPGNIDILRSNRK